MVEGGAGVMLVVPVAILRTVPCCVLRAGSDSSMGSCPSGKLW